MLAAGHMQPPMHNALILGNIREYRNKYAAAESVGVFSTSLPRCMECSRGIAMGILSVRLSVRQTRGL